MSISIGDITAILRLQDQLSPAVQQAAATVQASAAGMGRSFDVVKQQLATATQGVKDLQDAAQKYATSTGAVLAPIAAALDEAKGKEAELRAELEQMAPAAQAAADGLKNAGDSAQQAAGQGDAARASLQQLGMALSTIGLEMTAAVTVPIVGAATAAVGFATDFETQMTRVQTLAGASAEEVASLKQQVLDLAPAVGVGPADLAKGLFSIESEGFRGAQAMDILTTASKMSALGMGDMFTVSRTLVTTLKAFQQQGLDSATAADILVATVQRGDMPIDQLAGALGRVNAVAAALGIPFAEVGAAIATFTRVGVSSAEAVTGLRQLLLGLEAPTKQTRDALAQLGLTADDVRRSISENGLAKTLIDLIDKTNGNVDVLHALIPNVRALSEALSNAKSQGGDYLKVVDDITHSQGSLDTAFSATTQTMAFQWDQLLSTLKVVAIQLGDQLLPNLKILINDILIPGVQHLADWVKWWGSLPEPIKLTSEGLVGLVALGGPTLLFFGSLARAISSIQLLLFGANAASETSVFSLLAKLGVGGLGLSAGTVAIGAGAAVAAGAAMYGGHKLMSGVQFAGNPNVSGLVTPGDIDLAKESHDIDLSKDIGSVSGFNFPNGIPDYAAGAAGAKTLADAVKALTAEQRANIDSLKEQGYNVTEIAKELGISANVVGVYERQQKALGSGGASYYKEWQKAAADMVSVLADPAWDGSYGMAIKLGASEHDLAVYFGETDSAVRSSVSAWRESETESRNWQKAADDLVNILKDPAWDGSYTMAVKLGASQQDLAVYFGQTTSQVREQINAERALQGQAAAYIDATQQNLSMARGLEQQHADDVAKISLNEFDYKRHLIDDWVNDEEGKIDYSVQNWTVAYDDIHVVAHDKYQQIVMDENDALTQMRAQELSWANEFQKTLGDLPKGLGSVLTGSGTGLGLAQGLVTDVGSDIGGKLFVAGGPLNGLGNAMTSGLSHIFGDSFGQAFGLMLPGLGSLLGPLLDKVLTPLMQKVGAFFTKMFGGTDWQGDVNREMGQFGAQLGVTFSDNLTKQIAADAEKYHSEVAGELLHLGDIAKEAGGITAQNLAFFTSKAHDLFSAVDQGLLSVEQAGTTLDTVFTDIAAAGTDAYGRISDSVKQLIELNDEYGTKSKEVAQFQSGQASNVMAGFTAVAAALDQTATFDQVGKAASTADTSIDAILGSLKPSDYQKIVDQLNAAYGNGYSGSIEQFYAQQHAATDPNAVLDKAIAAMKGADQQTLQDSFKTAVQQGFAGTIEQFYANQQLTNGTKLSPADIATYATVAYGTQHTQGAASSGDLNALGAQAVGAYLTEVGTGTSKSQALKDESTALTQLQKSYKDLGIDVSDVGLKSLFMQNALLTANPNLMAGVDGLSKEMVGLDNLSIETAADFAAQQTSGTEMYNQLLASATALGGGAADALGPMQDYLHNAQIEAAKLGVPLDANTQAMIDQSKQLGIWKDDTGAAETPLQKLADTIDDLARALRGLPPKVDTTVGIHYAPDGSIIPASGLPTPGDKSSPTGGATGTPGVPSLTLDLGGLPPPIAMAAGGDFLVTRPTLFLAGEAGAERARFSGAGNVNFTDPNQRVQQGDTNFIIVPVPPGASKADIIEAAIAAVPQKARQNGTYRSGLKQALDMSVASWT